MKIEDILFLIALLCVTIIFLASGIMLIVLNLNWFITVVGIAIMIAILPYILFIVQFVIDIIKSNK